MDFFMLIVTEWKNIASRKFRTTLINFLDKEESFDEILLSDANVLLVLGSNSDFSDGVYKDCSKANFDNSWDKYQPCFYFYLNAVSLATNSHSYLIDHHLALECYPICGAPAFKTILEYFQSKFEHRSSFIQCTSSCNYRFLHLLNIFFK